MVFFRFTCPFECHTTEKSPSVGRRELQAAWGGGRYRSLGCVQVGGCRWGVQMGVQLAAST